ncbi:MAG TPA: DUF6118 family protein [Acetobacteraceae bacterium]|nr:DUF6118 family protein [Acetobacteraceae bacterium]
MDDEADTGSAERAFAALRAEVAALRQAVEGRTAPDYALTLGAIVKELQAVGARLDAIEAAPPMQVTPATIAQQIREEAARLADGQVRQMQAAREGFERGQDTLGRVAFFQQRADRDRNILWAVGGGAALIGAVLGTMLFMEINRHAPDDWGWSADWAAWLMQANTVQAGYQLIDRNNPGLAAEVNEDIRLGNAYAGALHKCETEATQTGKDQRCVLSVTPPQAR